MSRGILILAAGLGKRMKSSLPKVLTPVNEEPLIHSILQCVKDAAPDARIGIIVGHGREQVETAIRSESRFSGLSIDFILQPEQKGTGHAVRCAVESVWGHARLKEKAPILVLPGDAPLIRPELIEAMLAPLPRGEVMRLLTITLENPKGYGRVLRKGKKVAGIVEEKDASPKERLIREVAASVYTFDPRFLSDSLPKLKTKNAQGEYYLTDLVAMASKKKMSVLPWDASEDLLGANDLWEITHLERVVRMRILQRWAREGVRFDAPETCLIGNRVQLAPGVRVGFGVRLQEATLIAAGARIDSHVTLTNVHVGAGAHVKQGTVAADSTIEEGASVGPYAHLRPESRVGKNAKIGNFVELKKTSVGEGTSIAHLSYLGDATVGARANIGCGFVTCNYDGRVIDGQRKHATVIEDEAFIGSDCQTVAPVRIGKGAYVASGSTVTENVESGALAIARSRQVNKPGYAQKLRTKK